VAKDVANIRVFGDVRSAVYVAPVGTTAPTAPDTAPAVGWLELGWLGEDGVTETREVDTDTKRAWQGGTVVRTVRTSDTRRFSVVALETNVVTAGLIRPGSTPSTTAGVTTTPVKSYVGQDVRAWIIDTFTADIETRKVITRGEVVEIGDVVYQNAEITAYELTIECLPDTNGVLYTELTNDPALEIEA
jgi:hypothetical protein